MTSEARHEGEWIKRIPAKAGSFTSAFTTRVRLNGTMHLVGLRHAGIIFGKQTRL